MMTSWRRTAVSAAALCIFTGANAAFADVTAEQVWADWRDYMTDAGYTLEATETRSGDTLNVTGVTMTFDVPEEDMSITMSMGDMGFVDNGDGTVSITVPPNLPLDIMVEAEDDEDVEIGLNYATEGLSIDVSGDPDNMSYDYTASRVALTLESLVVEGEELPMSELGQASFEMSDVEGSTQMSVGDLRESVQKITSGAVSYVVDISEPEGGEGRFVMRGQAEGLTFEGEAALPQDMDPNMMAQMVANGFAFDGTFSFTNGKTDFNFQEEGEVVQGSSSSSTGSLQFAMGEEGLTYAGEGTDIAISMAGGEIPFPIELAMAKTGFNLSMPVMSGDAEQDFAFGMNLTDFTMSDMIWGIFDPGGQLPRDPATVAFDLTGTGKLFVDLLDAEAMVKVEDGETVPGEVNSLDINSVTVSAAGAELTGDGSFSFDNTDMETFDGMPAPTGSLNLMLVGGNALLDKLVAMGFVPEEQAQGARMMMGLFAVRGEGEDTLTSTIEVTGDGQVLANGQRIK
uniref:DUF2125 domain-containing protein n=1 Tax=Roseovarius indicus TaxID=540747 RepID=UPI003B5285F7